VLLDEWKALPRLDKRADDELWHRFSTARSTHTRQRKHHFAELGEKRDSAKQVKVRLAAQAEALSSSTDWAATARAYRDLMSEWKAAGSAGRGDEDKLWSRFRAAQDAFFTARDAENSKLDEEFAANAVVKRAILEEAERLLPVTDPTAARVAIRPLADRWEEAGKVPRGDMAELERRFKAVEQAIKSAEDDRWERSNPEAAARAGGHRRAAGGVAGLPGGAAREGGCCWQRQARTRGGSGHRGAPGLARPGPPGPGRLHPLAIRANSAPIRATRRPIRAVWCAHPRLLGRPSAPTRALTTDVADEGDSRASRQRPVQTGHPGRTASPWSSPRIANPWCR
jgi:hypothetical protein